jgi:hypothetical protein
VWRHVDGVTCQLAAMLGEASHQRQIGVLMSIQDAVG